MKKTIVFACTIAALISAAAAEPIRITIDPGAFVGPPLVGFGAQMNPYIYARPNWPDVNDQNVGELEQKVLDLKPQFVRIFALPEWMDGKPDGVSKLGDPRMKASFIRTLRLAGRAGAVVTLTTWYGDPKEPEKTARRTVAMLHWLLNDEKITCLHSINMMNEPDMTWPGETNWNLDTYNRLYRELDSELKRTKLRDRIGIITGDMVEDYQPAWQTDIAEKLADLSDGISIHAYWQYNDTGWMLQRLDGTKALAATQPSIRNKPFYVTEFGSQGKNNGISREEPWRDATRTPIADTTIQPLQIAQFNIEAVNRGFAGTVQWDMYDAWYDRLMHYGVIADVYHHFELRPAYFMLQMFTHTCRPGWRAVSVTTEQALPAAALVGPKGEISVYMVNNKPGPRDVRIYKFAPDAELRVITWNADGRRRLSSTQSRVDKDQSVALFLPPSSITTVTTLNDWP